MIHTCKHISYDDDIPMQVCKSYDVHNIKLRNEREGVYEECKAPVYEAMS